MWYLLPLRRKLVDFKPKWRAVTGSSINTITPRVVAFTPPMYVTNYGRNCDLKLSGAGYAYTNVCTIKCYIDVHAKLVCWLVFCCWDAIACAMLSVEKKTITSCLTLIQTRCKVALD